MGKNRKSVGNATSIAQINNDMREKLIQDLVGVLTKEEEVNKFVDICNKYDVEIVSSISGPEYRGFDSAQGIDGQVVVKLKDGQVITISNAFLRKSVHDSGLSTMFDTLNKVPSFLKENFNTASFQDSLDVKSYYSGEGKITLTYPFLGYSDKHDLNMRGVIIHEISHSFDLGKDKIVTQDDLVRVCDKSLSNGKGFQEILKHEQSSMYSREYHPKGNTFGDKQAEQSVKFGTESFAEAMKITGKMKLFGKDYAYINVPVYNNDGSVNGYRTVGYNEWKRESPNLARISEQVWNAGSRSEARRIMENYKYDPNLNADVLTTDNYEERSILVEE